MNNIINKMLLTIAMATLFSGCDNTVDDGMTTSEMSTWIGKNVRVQFRRDALGAGAVLPISPETGEINGAETTVVGILLKVETKSIVISNHLRERSPKWIPREVILFVEANP